MKSKQVGVKVKGKRVAAKRIMQTSILKKHTNLPANYLLGSILSGITDGFFATDRRLNFTLVNPAFAKLSKMKPGNMLGKNMLELFPFMVNGVLVKKYRKSLQTQRPISFEHINPQNPHQIFSIHLHPNSKGIFVYYKDISNSKQSKVLLKAAELESRLIIQNSGDAILLTSPQGEIFSANPTACTLLQYSENEICEGGRDLVVDGSDPMLPTLLKERNEKGFFQGELTMKRKDGSRFVAEVNSTIFKSQKGELRTVLIFRDITERKKSTQRKEELLAQFEKISQHVPGFIYQFRLRKDGSSHFPYASKGIKVIYGLDPSEIADDGNKVFEMIHSDDLPRVAASISKSAATLQKWNSEFRLNLHNGQMIWVEGNSSPQAEADGGILWHGYIADITARKIAEQDLELKKFTINHSSDSIYWIRPDGSFADVNLAAGHFLGYSFDELIKMRVPQIDDHYNDEVWPHHWRELREKKHLTFETVQRKKGGILVEVEVNANHIVFNGEEFNCAFVRDITERKNSEKQLIESESKYRLLTDNMQDLVCLHSPVGLYEYVSPSSKKILGYEPEELLGKYPYNYFHPDDIDRIMKDAHQVMITENRVANITYRIRHKEGHYIWFETKSIPIYQENRLIAIQSSSQDVTMRKDFEEKLTISNTRLQAIFNNAVNGIALADDQGNYLDGNPAICQMLDYSHEEFVTLNASNIAISSQPNKNQFGEFISEGRAQGLVNLRAKSDRIVTARYNAVTNILPGVHLSILENVTETQKVERELSKSQNRLRAFFQSTTDAIILIDKDFKIIDYNKVATEYALLVLGKNLVHNMSMLEFTTKATEDAFKVDLLKAFQGEIIHVELEIFYPTGHKIWWKVQYIPITDDKNEIDVIAFNATNIDKEKRANQRLVNLTDNIPNGMIYEYWTKKDGTDHKFTYMSQGAEQLFEMDPQKLIDDVNLAFSLVVEEDIPSLMEDAKVAIQNLNNVDIQYRIKVPSGKVKWIRISAKPRELGDDVLLFEGVAMDITYQKNLEAEQARAAIKLRNVLDSMMNGIVQVNAQGKITYANKWACKILSLKRNEIQGQYCSSTKWNQIDTEGYPIGADQLPLSIALAQNKRVEKMVHGIINNKGTQKWLTVNANPLIDSKGNVTGAVASFEDITETRALEFSFHKNAEQMRLAAMMAKMGEWEVELVTLTPFWSDEVCRIHEVPLGYRPDLNEAIDFYTDEFKPVISQAVERCVKTGEHYDLILQIVTKKGNKKWVRTVGLRDQQNNKATKLYGLFQDINEMKLKEIELERLALIAKETDNLVIITGADRNIQWVNEAFTKITEYSLDEVLGKSPGTLLQGTDTDMKVVTLVRQKLDNNESVNFEIVNYSKSGRKYWLEVNIQPIFNNGKLNYFIAIESDITERKNNELKRIELNNSLTDFQNAIQSSSIVSRADKKGVITYVNEKFVAISGYPVDELIGQTHHVINSNHHPKSFWVDMWTTISKGENWRAEVKNRAKDGSNYWVDTFIMPFMDDSGQVREYLSIRNDITERKKQDDALLASNREKDFLIKEIHHRVKNNLQLISSIIYLKSMTLEPSQIKSFMDETRQKIRSMSNIHEHLLQSEKLSQVNSYDYMRKLIEEIQLTLANEGLDLKIETEIQNLTINLDTAMYCGLIVNELMTNAFKYAFRGMTAGRIKVTMSRDNEQYHINVSDNGIGISAENEPDQSHSFGMEMLSVFVKQLKGKMVVTRENGTVFRITF